MCDISEFKSSLRPGNKFICDKGLSDGDKKQKFVHVYSLCDGQTDCDNARDEDERFCCTCLLSSCKKYLHAMMLYYF